jgi:hypothetical protein
MIFFQNMAILNDFLSKYGEFGLCFFSKKILWTGGSLAKICHKKI